MQVTRRFVFDAAHRLVNHPGKCAAVHGHRYEAEITIDAKELDNLGMVLDFGIFKNIVGAWIDEHLDHNIILNKIDPLLQGFDNDYEKKYIFGTKEPFEMDCNPTAENIAELIFNEAKELLCIYGFKVSHVRLYETANCWADYSVSK